MAADVTETCVENQQVWCTSELKSVVLVSYYECPGVSVTHRNNSHNYFDTVIPLCVLTEICF